MSGSPTLDDARNHSEHAKTRLRVGLYTGAAGIAVLGSGVVWALVHHDSGERRTMTGWLAPGGGGLAITGPF